MLFLEEPIPGPSRIHTQKAYRRIQSTDRGDGRMVPCVQPSPRPRHSFPQQTLYVVAPDGMGSLQGQRTPHVEALGVGRGLGAVYVWGVREK